MEVMQNFCEMKLDADPVVMFRKLWESVSKQEFETGQMMILATVDKGGQPSARIVLFKDIKEKSVSFFTNYDSQKGQELAENAKACAVVYWPSIDVQVRLSGEVKKIPTVDSDSYFSKRSRGSQIGAWASQQSSDLESREALEANIKKFEGKFEGMDVPRPENWGGYEIFPSEMQFLHRRDNRLNDSFVYSYAPDGVWSLKRLAP